MMYSQHSYQWANIDSLQPAANLEHTEGNKPLTWEGIICKTQQQTALAHTYNKQTQQTFSTAILGGREHNNALSIHCIKTSPSISDIHLNYSSPHSPWRFDQAESPQDRMLLVAVQGGGTCALPPPASANPPTAASELCSVQEVREEQ